MGCFPVAGPSNDSLPAKPQGGVWPARPCRVMWPLHRHLPLRHPHWENVQRPPGEDGRQDQIMEETLVRFWPTEEELLLLHRWGRIGLDWLIIIITSQFSLARYNWIMSNTINWEDLAANVLSLMWINRLICNKKVLFTKFLNYICL